MSIYSAKVIRRWGLEAMRELMILHNAGLESILEGGQGGQGRQGDKGDDLGGRGGRGGRGHFAGSREQGANNSFFPMPYALCPMPNDGRCVTAGKPVQRTAGPMPNAHCPMPNA
jgi:hypothetical protein